MRPSGRPVLVVGVDRGYCVSVMQVLTLSGRDVVLAEDAAKALDEVRAGLRPSVVVVDTLLSRTLIPSLRADADPALARVPVVLLTPDLSAASRLPQGCVALRKPVTEAALLDVIAKVTAPHS